MTAAGMAVAISLIFAATVPFATVPMQRIGIFIPLRESAVSSPICRPAPFSQHCLPSGAAAGVHSAIYLASRGAGGRALAELSRSIRAG